METLKLLGRKDCKNNNINTKIDGKKQEANVNASIVPMLRQESKLKHEPLNLNSYSLLSKIPKILSGILIATSVIAMNYLTILPPSYINKNILWDSQNIIEYKTNVKKISSLIGVNPKIFNTSKKLHFGPAIMLNGLTNTGKWYQFGIQEGWPKLEMIGNRYVWVPESHFKPFIEVWNKKGKSIIDKEYTFPKNVSKKDIFELQMNIKNNKIEMEIKDMNNNEICFKRSIAEKNVKYFEGSEHINKIDQKNDYFTGIMSERYYFLYTKSFLAPKIDFKNIGPHAPFVRYSIHENIKNYMWGGENNMIVAFNPLKRVGTTVYSDQFFTN